MGGKIKGPDQQMAVRPSLSGGGAGRAGEDSPWGALVVGRVLSKARVGRGPEGPGSLGQLSAWYTQNLACVLCSWHIHAKQNLGARLPFSIPHHCSDHALSPPGWHPLTWTGHR